MGRRRWLRAAALAVCLAALALFQLWKRGRPYGSPEWSPNRQYYLQRYASWTPLQYLPRMPGDGGTYDGYIRLYDRRGRLLGEGYHTNNHFVRPVWSGRELWLQAGGGGDEGPWQLPTPSE